MSSLLERSIFVLLTITMAACTSVGDAPGAEGSGGTSGTGGSASAPTVTLSATPMVVANSGKTQLNWSSTNAESCTAKNGWEDTRPPEGGPEDRFVFRDTRYELTCTGPGGTASDQVDVSINTSQLLVSVDMDLYLVKGGDIFNVNVTVSNPGIRTVQNVFVNLVIPQYVVINQDALPSNATCSVDCGEGDMLAWEIGSVAAGKVTFVSVESEVAQTVPDGENIQFEVTTTADDEPNAVVTENTTEGDSDLGLGLVQAPNQPEAGDVVVYTLSYDNSGADPLPQVELTLTLPALVNFENASNGGTVDDDGVVTWTFTQLAAGESGQVEATVEVNPTIPPGAQLRAAAGASVNGTAVRARATTLGAVGDEPVECLFDDECAEDESCDEQTNQCIPNMIATIEVNPNPVRQDEHALVNITVTNPTGDPITADVVLLLPEYINTVGAVDRSEGAICGAGCGAGGSVSWTIEELGAGESEVLWVRPKVISTFYASAPPNGTELTFTVDVEIVGGMTLRKSATAVVNGSRALDLRVDESVNPVKAGDDLRYTIHYANRSPDPLDSVELTFQVPDRTTHSSGDRALLFNLGRLAAGEGGVQEVTVAVDGAAPSGTQLRAVTEVTDAGSDEVSRVISLTPVGEAALITTVEVNPDPVLRDEHALVNITVTNPTGDPITADVVLLLPEYINTVGAVDRSEGAICGAGCGAGGSVSWTIEELGAGESEVLWVRPKVISALYTSSTPPFGTLLPFEVDVRPSNSVTLQAVASARVAARVLSLRVDESVNPVKAGDDLRYTIHYANRSPDPLDSVELTFQVPDRTTHSSGDRALLFNLGRLAAGEGGVQEVTVAVDGAAPSGTQLRAVTEVTDAGSDEVSRVISLTPVGEAALITTVEVNPDPVLRDEHALVNITVTNPTGDPITADVVLLLPEYINTVGAVDRSEGAICGAGCGAGGSVSWTIEELGAGESEVLWVRPKVISALYTSSTPPFGTLLPFEVDVRPSNSVTLQAVASARVAARVLSLRVDESVNPVKAGDDLRYTIHYANRSPDPLDSVELTFQVPDRTTHSSGDRALLFNLGRLAAGEGGVQEVTVAVDGAAPSGTQLRAVTEVTDAGSDEVSRVISLTPVGEAALITTVEVNPDPVLRDEHALVNITVTNPTGDPITADVVLLLPEYINTVGAVDRSEGAICGAGCGAGGSVSWTIEELGAGESEVLWVRPKVISALYTSSTPPFGTLLPFEVDVRPTNSVTQLAADTARVHQP